MTRNYTQGVPELNIDREQDPEGAMLKHFLKDDLSHVSARTLEDLGYTGNHVEVNLVFGGLIQSCATGSFVHKYRYRRADINVALPNPAPSKGEIDDLYFAIFHETAHAARYFSPSFTPARKTAMQHCVDEGISNVFARTRTSHLPPKYTYRGVEGVATSLVAAERNNQSIPREWLTRNDPLTPYRIGSMLVDRAMRNDSLSIEELIPMQYIDIVERM